MRFDRITSTDDFAFDFMFDQSINYLEGGNLDVPAGHGIVDLRELMRSRINITLDTRDGFGSIYRDDDGDYCLTTGTIAKRTYYVGLSVVAPINGSRAFIHSKAWGEEWVDHIRQLGVEVIELSMPRGSSIASLMCQRHGCKPPTLLNDGSWRQRLKINEV